MRKELKKDTCSTALKDFNQICITQTASTILALFGIPPADQMAPPIQQVLKQQPACDRIFMYNPDAVAMWIYEKYAEYFKEMEKGTDLKLPMLSVIPPVTPVCFGSMYSGLLPADHGILKYEKPILSVPTVFDLLPRAGKKAAIVSTEGDSISRIFLNRDIDYFIYPSKETCNRKALELIEQNRHDLIVLYNGDYDYQMHRHTPEGKKALNALQENIATYRLLHTSIQKHWTKQKAALAFAPDHGCHKVFGFLGNHGENKPCDMNIMHFYSFLS